MKVRREVRWLTSSLPCLSVHLILSPLLIGHYTRMPWPSTVKLSRSRVIYGVSGPRKEPEGREGPSAID